MPITYDELITLDLPEREFTYTDRDAMLYALSVGMGQDPMDIDELDFVFEKQLKVLPSLATVIAWDYDWLATSGLNVQMVVHAGQQVSLHKPLKPQGRICAKTRIVDVFDKGADRGALIVSECVLRDAESGDLVVTLLSTILARGDGGFDPSGRKEIQNTPLPHDLPSRVPDVSVTTVTQPNQALLYRLCGDRNPLHVDPQVALAAGFPRPILHGLCTLGYAVRALVKAVCDHDPARIASVAVRFKAPVFPGEAIRTDIWRNDDLVLFRASVVDRDVPVLDFGHAALTSQTPL